MTSVPYPTFVEASLEQRASLAAVGRCRIHGDGSAAYRAIVAKCIEQASVHPDAATDKEASKQLEKMYMKQSVAMASEYLQSTLKLDVSIVDVEVLVVDLQDIIDSSGCLASCFLDAGCAKIVFSSGEQLPLAIGMARIPRERLMVHVSDANSSSDLLAVIDQVKDDCDSVSVFVESDANLERISNLLATTKDVKGMDLVVQFQPTGNDCSELVGTILKSTPSNTTGTTVTLIDPSAEQLGRSYAACLKTDRPDGLYTTVVCTRSGEALGLVYSSVESIVAALECGRRGGSRDSPGARTRRRR